MSEAAVSSDIRQEANSALIEVDKGLRSASVGDQCEAIVKCPALMDKFPFPIMTSTALLKLADVFSAQTTGNLLRLHILRVFQLSQRHLGKVTNTEELVRRLSLVSHSNDPVARALTLRLFGSIASIVAERKNIHHSIHHGLDSHNQVEVEAAIFATSCLVCHSGTFAAGVCEKIASTVQGLSVPVEMKLRVIPILSRMHHDITTATQVRELCLKLLPSYPAFSLVTATLHTLTVLATATKIHIPDQVWLLLSYAGSDARLRVRLFAMREVMHLASQAPHMWTTDMTQAVLEYVSETVSEREMEAGMAVLLRLSHSVAVQNMTTLHDGLVPLCYSTHTNTAALALSTVTNIVMETNQTSDGVSSSSHVTELTDHVIETLLVADFSSKSTSLGMQCLLRSLVKVSAVSGAASKSAMNTLLSLLPQFSGQHLRLLCDAMVSIATSTGDMWSDVAPTLTDYLTHHTHQLPQLLPSLTAVLQELHAGEWDSPQRQSFQSNVLPTLMKEVWSPQLSLWLAYRLARRASMKGYHEVAEPVYRHLSERVTVARFHHWLSALHLFSSSQLLLSPPATSQPSPLPPPPSQLIPALSSAAALVSKATMLIKASNPPSSFPLRYLTSLSSLLRAHHQLLTSCVCVSLMSSSPSSLNQKFQYCVSQFQTLADDLSKLYRSLFDADSSSLHYISLLQQSCLLVVSIISSVALSRKPLVSPGKVSTPVTATAPTPAVGELSDFSTREVLGRSCRALLEHIQPQIPTLQAQPVGEEHACLLTECSQRLLQVPLKLPLHFFTSLQHTTVQLAFSPSLPGPGQSVPVPLHSHLSLKVEGVVQHTGKSIHRQPSSVCVRVKATLEKAFTQDHKNVELPSLQRVEPVVNDYFLAQFLITLPLSGYFFLHTTSSLLDQQGIEWEAGPQVKMSVLVDTEQNLRQHERQREGVVDRPGRENAVAGPSRSGGIHSH